MAGECGPTGGYFLMPEFGYTAASPVAGWWRDGFQMGQRCWVDDPVRGRAGVRFEAVEAS